MKNFLASHLVRLDEIDYLVALTENKQIQKEFRRITKSTFKNFKTYLIIEVIARSAQTLFALDLALNFFMGKEFNIFFVIILLIATLLNVIKSFILNKYVHHNMQCFNYLVFSPTTAFISKIVNNEKKNKVMMLQQDFGGYLSTIKNAIEKVIVLAGTTLPIIVIVIMRGYYIHLLIILFITVIVIIGGLFWKRIYKKYLDELIAGRSPSNELLNKRSWVPLYFNYPAQIIIPFLVVYSLKYQYLFIIPTLTILSNYIDFLWESAGILPRLLVTRSLVTELVNEIKAIEDKYVFNNKGYLRQCDMISYSQSDIKQSGKNNSLLLNEFAPMTITNSTKKEHVYSFEFKPGIYQIVGNNGTGKTTLFKSIALPENYQNEYSSGSITLAGKPIFNNKLKLDEHRKRFGYIGHRSVVPKVKDLNLTDFKKYPAINSVISNLIEENHSVLSEGEQAIVLLLSYINNLESKESSVLLVDEVFSRLHNSAEFPVRDEAIKLLKDFTNKNDKLIVLIVDHLVDIDFAHKVNFTKKKLEALNSIYTQ